MSPPKQPIVFNKRVQQKQELNWIYLHRRIVISVHLKSKTFSGSTVCACVCVHVHVGISGIDQELQMYVTLLATADIAN